MQVVNFLQQLDNTLLDILTFKYFLFHRNNFVFPKGAISKDKLVDR